MLNNKTVWLESQYLFPHHFQQQERYLEGRIEQRCAAISPYVWGFHEIAIDTAALAEGRVALTAARGIMPDGTPFDLPGGSPLPPPLRIPPGTRDQRVVLALPLYQPGACYVDVQQSGDSNRVARYRLQVVEVFDYSGQVSRPEPVETAVLNCSLHLESAELGGYTTLPLAQVREVTPEGAVVLESAYIATTFDVQRSTPLSNCLSDVIGLLHQRGEALAMRFNQAGKAGGASAIADFLLLQLINRHEARLRHLAGLRQLHPERLYAQLLELAGELATFTTEAKRTPRLPPYRHDDLYACFRPVMDALSRQLSAVLEQTAIAMPVEARQYGIYVAAIGDRSLLKQARFVLAAKADLPTEALREQLASLIKVGAVETIRNLVNNHLPGIGLTALPVAPREIPYHAGFVYFELDSRSEHWQQLKSAGGFAFHVAAELPGLELELWAIRH